MAEFATSLRNTDFGYRSIFFQEPTMSLFGWLIFSVVFWVMGFGSTRFEVDLQETSNVTLIRPPKFFFFLTGRLDLFKVPTGAITLSSMWACLVGVILFIYGCLDNMIGIIPNINLSGIIGVFGGFVIGAIITFVLYQFYRYTP